MARSRWLTWKGGRHQPAVRDRDILLADRLLVFFNQRTGRWAGPAGEAWQPALAVEAILNVYARTGVPSYLTVVRRSFARYRGRRSRFFDDDGWYLNAWLRAYEVTGEQRYLDEASSLFTRMTQAWDDRCGGGLWWHEDRNYKNAITNELFLLAATRLHRGMGASARARTFYDWALRTWSWLEASGMINEAHRINDGLDASCLNNGGTTWTYNQGVILGGLVGLSRMTGRRGYLVHANQIADATISDSVYPGGILKEPGEESGCDADAQIFKGIFMQGLARLHRADPTGTSHYRRFLELNADQMWIAGRDTDNGVGLRWSGPTDVVNMATQTSALLLISELALVHKNANSADPQGC